MSKNKSRLGRGLSSLLGEDAPPSEAEAPESSPPAAEQRSEGMFHVELSSVSVNPHQPRRQFDDESLRLLAESLKSSGLIQPIVVRPWSGGYQLVAGERRFRAAKLAGLDRLPAVVRVADEAEQAQLALVENIHRQDLNPIDRAAAYSNLMTHLKLTQAELAARLNEERSSVANYLRLLDLSGPVREMIVDGRLSMGHAKLLAGVHDVLLQQRLADQVVADQLSVRQLEASVRSTTKANRVVGEHASPSAHIADLERRISRGLQMRCQVQRVGSKGKGRLVIHYGSLDQFDHLLGRLGVAGDEA